MGLISIYRTENVRYCIKGHLKQPDRVVSGADFLLGGVIECDIAHRRSGVTYAPSL